MSANLTAIFLEERHSLMWTVMRIVRDPQTAEDLAQETYVRARRAIETKQIGHIRAFLYHTAKNLALDHIRREKTRGRYEEQSSATSDLFNVAMDAPSPEVVAIQKERLRRLEDALQALPERTRRVCILARIEGWPYPRIAEHLGISERTVFNDIKLALAHCHDALARLESD